MCMTAQVCTVHGKSSSGPNSTGGGFLHTPHKHFVGTNRMSESSALC